jgi:hypothetical protein
MVHSDEFNSCKVFVLNAPGRVGWTKFRKSRLDARYRTVSIDVKKLRNVSVVVRTPTKSEKKTTAIYAG